MAQQKSEDCIVPEGRGNPVQTRGIVRRGGGKAVPVKGEDQQLVLNFGTAENLRSERGSDNGSVLDRSRTRPHKVATRSSSPGWQVPREWQR